MDRQTDTDRQTDRQTRTDRQTERLFLHLQEKRTTTTTKQTNKHTTTNKQTKKGEKLVIFQRVIEYGKINHVREYITDIRRSEIIFLGGMSFTDFLQRHVFPVINSLFLLGIQIRIDHN